MGKSKYDGLKDLKLGEGGAISQPMGSPIITPKERTLTGKRSDPAWKQRSVLLKNHSFDQARDILKRKYNGRDFSELMQALLDQWLQTEMPS